MLRRMPEEHKERALYILNDQKNKKKRSKYDGLYGLPHGDGLGDKPDWPTVDAIEECRRMNYYPSVFVLKPGQFVHINKGRLHAFRKLSPTDLPPNDCHRQLRLGINKEHGPKEHICISVAWDWMVRATNVYDCLIHTSFVIVNVFSDIAGFVLHILILNSTRGGPRKVSVKR